MPLDPQRDAAFLRDICEHADDDTPRLIYADWLEENGEPLRAEFIRVQCRLHALTPDAPDHFDLQERDEELQLCLGGSAFDAVPLPPLKNVTWGDLDRGFLSTVEVELREEEGPEALDGICA